MGQRNVLLIVVDQWRADCVPHLLRESGEAPHLRTPALDRLCRAGVTFANHVTTAVPCGPARASLHTGLYMMNHRQVQNWVPLDSRHPTLPRAARAAGYEPALIGYTTTTPDPRVTAPRDPGFSMIGDVMPGWKTVGGFGPDMDGYFGWLAHKGFALPANREDIWLPADGGAGATTQPARVPSELSDSAFFTDRALTYLKGRNGRPFFLHLGYYRPHPPFVASAPYHAMYDAAEMPAPVRAASPEAEAAQHPLLEHFLRSSRQSGFFRGGEGMSAALSEADARQMRATYYGMMSEVDHQLSLVLGYLDATDQTKDTLIVFTSDHGEQLGDHHLLGKLGYFDESFRIPLVIVDPDVRGTRGGVQRAFTESIDVMPTLLEWIGGEVPPAIDGRGLGPLLRSGGPTDWRDALHYEFDFRDTPGSEAERALKLPMNDCALSVIQDAAYKYVHFTALPPLLFDLRADPHQFVNLAEDADHRDVALEYAQRALSWRMGHADRTLTHYLATPNGLENRMGNRMTGAPR